MTAARHAFQVAARYLLAAGWTRDGDDLGIWIDPTVASPWGIGRRWTFGEALARQLDRDGVTGQEEAGHRPLLVQEALAALDRLTATLSEPGGGESPDDMSPRDTDAGRIGLAARSLHAPGSLSVAERIYQAAAHWERDGVSTLSAVEPTSEAPVPGASGTAASQNRDLDERRANSELFRAASAKFTWEERTEIRKALGLPPFTAAEVSGGTPAAGHRSLPEPDWFDGVVARSVSVGGGFMRVMLADWNGVCDGWRMGERLLAEAVARAETAERAQAQMEREYEKACDEWAPQLARLQGSVGRLEEALRAIAAHEGHLATDQCMKLIFERARRCFGWGDTARERARVRSASRRTRTRRGARERAALLRGPHVGEPDDRRLQGGGRDCVGVGGAA